MGRALSQKLLRIIRNDFEHHEERISDLESQGNVVPTGTRFRYAGSSAPTGFLICDGSEVSRTTYADLFAAIGTAFGPGDGSTTFNLPDSRERVSIGVGTGAGLTARSRGDEIGASSHTLTEAEMASHDHDLTDPGHSHDGLWMGATGANNYFHEHGS